MKNILIYTICILSMSCSDIQNRRFWKARAEFVSTKKYVGPCGITNTEAEYPTTSFRYNEKKQLIYKNRHAGSCGTFGNSGVYYSYDSLGRLIKKEIGRNPAIRVEYFKYDKSGNVLQIRERSQKLSKMGIDVIKTFKYEFYDTGKIKLIYENKWFDTGDNFDNGEGIVDESEQTKIQITYDERGNKKEEEEFAGNRTEPLFITKYKYDENNNLIRKNRIINAHRVSELFSNRTTIYQYDNFGNVVFEEEYDDKKGKKSLKHRYQYWYECWAE